MKFTIKTKLRDYQEYFAQEGAKRKCYVYQLKMGQGKTLTALRDFQLSGCSSLLVLAPKGVYRAWSDDQLPTHTDIVPYTYQADKSKEVTDSNCLLFNIESVGAPRGRQWIEQWLKKQKEVFLIIDEATCIKGKSTVRIKALNELRNYFSRIRLLSGTWVTKGPLDIWEGCNFMDWRLLGFSSFFSFRARYCQLVQGKRWVVENGEAKERIFKQVVGFKNLDDLHKRISLFSARHKEENPLDLPPKIYYTRELEMTEEQKKIYKDLKDQNFTLLNDSTVSVQNKLTLLLRFQQVLAGHIKTDEGKVTRIKSNRINALLSVLEEMEGKVIIWTQFRESIKEIEESLLSNNYNCVTYYGGTEDRQDSLLRFQKDVNYLIANQVVGGYGLNLQHSNNMIFFTNTFDYAVREQAEARQHRGGQELSVNIVDLVVPNTLDIKTVNLLKAKKEISSLIIDGSIV